MSERKNGAAVVAVETSHGRPRVALRRPTDGGTPALPPPAEAAPERDTTTGRFVAGNRAGRRRTIKRLARGISTLNPTAVAPWLQPSVREAIAHAVDLAERFPDPALTRLVGATADAHAVFRGLLVLGAQGDAKALAEAKAWLREYRASVRELAALAGVVASTKDDDDAGAWAALQNGDDR